MNLLDLIDADVPVRALIDPEGWKKHSEEYLHAKWAAEHASKGYAGSEARKWTQDVYDIYCSVAESRFLDATLNDQTLSSHGIVASGYLAKLNKTPKVVLGELLDIAMHLGFVCVPVDYVDIPAITGGSAERYGRTKEQEAVEAFASLDFSKLSEERQKSRKPTKSGLDVYVLGPATVYSLDKHLGAANSNREVFSGKNEQAFLALRLALPTLRAMRVQISTINQNIEALWQNQRDNRYAVDQLKASQEQLKDEVSRMRGDMVEQLRQVRAAADAALREMARSHTESWASMRTPGDPLMFAIRTGTSIRAREASAFLGPCWGPDFDDIIAAAVSLKASKENREKVGNLLKVWW